MYSTKRFYYKRIKLTAPYEVSEGSVNEVYVRYFCRNILDVSTSFLTLLYYWNKEDPQNWLYAPTGESKYE